MLLKKKKKYYALILQKQEGTYNRIGKKRLRPTTKEFNFRKKPFKINVEKPAYVRGLKVFYFFDLTTSQQILVGNNKSPIIDADIMDMIYSKKIVKQLTTNLNNTAWKMNLTTLILGIAIGGAFGFIIKGYV